MFTCAESLSLASGCVSPLSGRPNALPNYQTRFIFIILVVGILLCGPGAAVLRAQSCPLLPPTQHSHGSLVVLEGPVVEPGSTPRERGHDAAVALDDPATGGARFLVAWVTDLSVTGLDSYDDILRRKGVRKIFLTSPAVPVESGHGTAATYHGARSCVSRPESACDAFASVSQGR